MGEEVGERYCGDTSQSISRPQRNLSAVTHSPCHSADVVAIAEVAAEALEAATEVGEVVSEVDVEVSRLARQTQCLKWASSFMRPKAS